MNSILFLFDKISKLYSIIDKSVAVEFLLLSVISLNLYTIGGTPEDEYTSVFGNCMRNASYGKVKKSKLGVTKKSEYRLKKYHK